MNRSRHRDGNPTPPTPPPTLPLSKPLTHVSHAPSLPHTATCTSPSRSTAPFRYVVALSMLHVTSFRTPALFLSCFPAIPFVSRSPTPNALLLRWVTVHSARLTTAGNLARSPPPTLSKLQIPPAEKYRKQVTKYGSIAYTLRLDLTSCDHAAASASVLQPTPRLHR